MDDQPFTPKRKRGGQPGNTNAVKDGFFADRLHQRAYEIASRHAPGDLADEMLLLHRFLHRVHDEHFPTMDLHKPANQAQIFSLLALIFIRILRSENIIGWNFNLKLETAMITVLVDMNNENASKPRTPSPSAGASS